MSASQTWRDLNSTKRDLLVWLVREGPATNREAADAIGVSAAWVTRVRGDLEGADLVATERVDGRTLSLDVTDAGRELVAEQFSGIDA